jgi:hypothetical protein
MMVPRTVRCASLLAFDHGAATRNGAAVGRNLMAFLLRATRSGSCTCCGGAAHGRSRCISCRETPVAAVYLGSIRSNDRACRAACAAIAAMFCIGEGRTLAHELVPGARPWLTSEPRYARSTMLTSTPGRRGYGCIRPVTRDRSCTLI